MIAVACAMVLDAVLGEPKWLWDRLPHPAILMGRAVGWFDKTLNDGSRRNGVLAVCCLVFGACGLGLVLAALPGWWADVLIGAMLLAQKSLVQHVAAVGDALRISLGDGRRAVAMIVGRDVRDMDAAAVARSAIESAAENLSDGVIAPLFWFSIAGLPGLLAYKVVNTADSMIGYRTERYEAFGWAAAKLDDALNWVPARITAALIWLATSNRASWRAIRADAALHRSPNAGWPEAAMAPALGVALSGPRSYDGQMQDFPWVHGAGRKDARAADIDAACAVLWKVWGIALIAVILIALL